MTIGVSDGSTSTALNLAVTETNGGPHAFRVTRVGTGFAQPLFVAPVQGNSGRAFDVERGGTMRILTPGGANSLLLDVFADVSLPVSNLSVGTTVSSSRFILRRAD